MNELTRRRAATSDGWARPRTLLGALAIALALPGVASAGAEGLWTLDDPFNCIPDSDSVMRVSRDRFDHYEDHCAFGGEAPKGFRSVSATMQCSAEGDEYVDDVVLEARGDTLRMDRGGYVSIWHRCLANEASLPSVTMPTFTDDTTRTLVDAAAMAVMMGSIARAIEENR